MIDYNDKNAVPDWNNGKIHGWNGGECPVHPETLVKTWRRIGGCEPNLPAKKMEWGHLKHCGDIIAFQVVKAYVEPKVIWVNEYPDELAAYPDEQSARSVASIRRPPMRIAVKYVEVVNENGAQE